MHGLTNVAQSKKEELKILKQLNFVYVWSSFVGQENIPWIFD